MDKKSGKKKVLFVCIGNMIRSQMAEGFARHGGSAFIDAYSAGVRHTGTVSEEAAHVMHEKGIDIQRQRSKGLDEVPLQEMDYIVNMSGYANESVFPAALPATFISWKIGDPLGGSIAQFRTVRDEIGVRVDELLRRIWREGSGQKDD
jgi:arsenate reductase (thioredoxin)